MRPGERITLIKRIAGTLSDESWADVGLTLREFGIDHDDEHRGGPYEMILDAAQGADDDALLGLNAHLHPGGRTQAPPSGGPWDPDAFRLFISHTHRHREYAGKMRTTLKRVGIDSFVAHDTIEPGKEWVDEIESALNTCDAAVAILTPDFRESKWCDQEIGFCVARAVPVVALRMPEDPHGFIGKYQGIKVVPPRAAAEWIASDVFDLLAKHDQTRARMVRPIVQRYARSGSFDSTRSAFALLAEIPKAAWTDQMIEDVIAAGKNNGQIAGANLRGGRSIPKAVEEHLATLGLLPVVHSPDDDIPF